MVKNRNPLFVPGTFLGPEQMCVDELHTMHLGIFSVFVRIALWRFVEADVWGVRAGRANAVGDRAVSGRLRKALFDWYKEASKRPGGPPIYEFSRF